MITRLKQILTIVLVITCARWAHGQTLQTIYSFSGAYDGFRPSTGLIQGPFESFFGATLFGGTSVYGTLFVTGTNGGLYTLHSFNRANGAGPVGALISGGNHCFYGITQQGGSFNGGTIFRASLDDRDFITLVSFDGTNGWQPYGLIQGRDGSFYGQTLFGGANGQGTIFKLTGVSELPSPWPSDPVLITLIAFTSSGEMGARSQFIQARDGDIYGVNSTGGENNHGAIFKMTTNGVITTLFSFGGINGSQPSAALVQGNNGDFYGTTSRGGLGDYGTVFKWTAEGNFTSLFSFSNTDGSSPRAPLLRASDGNLYGTTSGTLFRITPEGRLTTLAVFRGSNGAGPVGKLLERNGYLFGATSAGGTGYGTVFKILIPPVLNFTQNGSELVLSWPTNAVGFALQSAFDLNSPTGWIDFTNSPTVVGAQFTTTNLISGDAQFYRLKRQ